MSAPVKLTPPPCPRRAPAARDRSAARGRGIRSGERTRRVQMRNADARLWTGAETNLPDLAGGEKDVDRLPARAQHQRGLVGRQKVGRCGNGRATSPYRLVVVFAGIFGTDVRTRSGRSSGFGGGALSRRRRRGKPTDGALEGLRARAVRQRFARVATSARIAATIGPHVAGALPLAPSSRTAGLAGAD